MVYFDLLYIIPKNWFSFIAGKLAHSTLPFNLHHHLKTWFVNHYRVDFSEAEYSLDTYRTLGDFFSRGLKDGARPIADSILVSPVDGRISKVGELCGECSELEQVKGKKYSLEKLTGGQWDISEFSRGLYVVLYLAPHNYHRIHSPVHGEVKKVVHIPGSLWPVNDWGIGNIDGLFVCNERIIVHIKSQWGNVLVVMVGAANVGNITLDFSREISGNRPGKRKLKTWTPDSFIHLAKGERLGCFNLGSSVILIGDSEIRKLWNGRSLLNDVQFTRDRTIKMGESLIF
jgi:phosphatidylserine decarboxylase